MRAFTTFLRQKYEPIAVGGECVAYMTEVVRREPPTAWRDQLERPISPEEVHFAVREGAKNQASESDGIGLEFYKTNWATVKDDISTMMNQMFTERKVSTQQKHGLIVCLPKSSETTTPADFRPITLLKADYKILARIIANRLGPMMAEPLQQSQYCWVPGNTIFEAVATVREAIAPAEVKQAPLCVLSLDIQETFDKIPHQYLFAILRSHGFSNWFVEHIKGVYEEAVSSVQINGHIARSIPIRCSIKQGCPMI